MVSAWPSWRHDPILLAFVVLMIHMVAVGCHEDILTKLGPLEKSFQLYEAYYYVFTKEGYVYISFQEKKSLLFPVPWFHPYSLSISLVIA